MGEQEGVVDLARAGLVAARVVGDLRVGDGALDAVAELLDAVRVAGDAALSGGPVSRRQVEEHLGQAVVVQPGLQGLGRIVIGKKEVLHSLEAGPGGGREAVEELHLGEQHAEVGGELGHRELLGSLVLQVRAAMEVGASSTFSARASNSVTPSRSVPMAMLVTRSRITSTTTGTRYSAIRRRASRSAGAISSGRVTRSALQPSPSTTATWSTP